MNGRRSDDPPSARSPTSPTAVSTAVDTVETDPPSSLEDTATELPTVRPQRRRFGDERPTEIFAPKQPVALHAMREQAIEGSTIREMIKNPEHHLGAPLRELVERAQADLPNARVNEKSSLILRHEFEFDFRVGYHLTLTMYDDRGGCIEVQADVDSDGRQVRRGSMVSQIIPI